MVYLEFVLPGPPISYQTSDRANLKAWQVIVRAEASKTWTAPPLTGKLKFSLINFHEGDKPPMDDDNMVKPIRDALNGLAYVDDRQIRYSETLHVPIDDPIRIRGASAILLAAYSKGDQFLYGSDRGRPRRHSTPEVKAVDFATELQRIAEQYRAEGYAVVTHPLADHLPAFATGFGVDLLATRGQEKVLVQVKRNRAELEKDPGVPQQAAITNAYPGWRYDLVLLEPDDPSERAIRGTTEPTDEQLHAMLDRAEASRKLGVNEATVLLAWGTLEAAMRRHAGRAGGGRELQPRVLLNQLYSSGALTREEFDRLGRAWKLRTEIAHGFVAAPVDDALIETMVDVTRRLLEEGRAPAAMAT